MNRPSVISLFTGAGGLDLGFESAGFETRVAVDSDRECCETIRRNRPDWSIIEADIRSSNATSARILQTARLRPGDPDLLIGGPPCQPFSKSGYWVSGDVGRLNDPDAETLDAFLRVLGDAQPKAFLIENVPGLAFNNKDEGLQYLRKSIGRINRRLNTNYSFNVAILKAVEYGVPQDRRRVFVVGSRDGKEFKFPVPTHISPTEVQFISPNGDDGSARVARTNLQPYVRSWDALFDLEDDNSPGLALTGKWADLIPSIPEGENYLFHTERGEGRALFGWRRRYWNFLLKLSKELPSWTIPASPGPATGPFHWRNRRLSPRELMRLQTFPDTFEIGGNLRSVQRQVGNAVPCLLAEHLAIAIRQQFLEPSFKQRTPKLAMARRQGIPPAEHLKKVPRRFLEMAGDYPAHPGTGKGFSASKRNGDVK